MDREEGEWWLGEKEKMDPLDPQLAMHLMIDYCCSPRNSADETYVVSA
jgi:hypothetical protein